MPEPTLDLSGTNPANKDVANVAKPTEMSAEEKIASLARFIQFEPLIREIDYKILKYCQERRELKEIEEYIASQPEFNSVTRDQYNLITELVSHHGLSLFELTPQGDIVTPSDKEGLSEDELDDLVASFAYQTTETGKAIIEKLNPLLRLKQLFEVEQERKTTYVEILKFLGDKHSLAEVDALLRNGSVNGSNTYSHQTASQTTEQTSDQNVSQAAKQTVKHDALQTSVFIDKLERAGAIFFDAAWQITEGGKRFLLSVTN